MVYSIAILHSIVEFHRSTSFSIYVVVEGRRLLRWHGIEKKAWMPFSVFHSWLERLLVFFFLAWLACLGSRNSSRHTSSVRQRGSRKTLTTPWIDPHCTAAASVLAWPPQPPPAPVAWLQPLLFSSFPTNHHQPTPSASLIDSCQERASTQLDKWGCQCSFSSSASFWGCSRGCGGCWQQLEAMEGESSQHHAILLLTI